jgi:hypothetical protein
MPSWIATGWFNPWLARNRAEENAFSEGLHPNDLWCTGHKGEFQLSDKRLLLSLTVTDYSLALPVAV